MLKKTKKIILVIGAIILVIVVGRVMVYSYKSHEPPRSPEGSETEKPPSKTIPPVDKNPPPVIFPINGIPAERKHDWGGKWELTSAEEKAVIESLSSQVNIDKTKSFFDYKWGFGMVPGNREIFLDSDHALYLFTDKGRFFVSEPSGLLGGSWDL